MSQKNIGIADLKARLSAHLRAVRQGAEIVVLDRGNPVAKVVPVETESRLFSIREPKYPFADFQFARRKNRQTDSLGALLEERTERF